MASAAPRRRRRNNSNSLDGDPGHGGSPDSVPLLPPHSAAPSMDTGCRDRTMEFRSVVRTLQSTHQVLMNE